MMQFNEISTIAILSFALSADTLLAQNSRTEFFEKLVRVEQGMPIADVYRILGDPERVLTRSSDQLGTADAVQVWGYGYCKQGIFPSLGRVEFDSDFKVARVIGAKREPVVTDSLSEDQLRKYLEMLHASPAGFSKYDPYEMVIAINQFQPMGQETFFSIVREYFRLTDNRSAGRRGACRMLLCLHELPVDLSALPVTVLGTPIPNINFPREQIPRFPFVMIGNVPFLVTRGLNYGAVQPSFETIVRNYENKIPWLSNPLTISEHSEEQLSGELQEFVDSIAAVNDDANFTHSFLDSQLKLFIDRREKSLEGPETLASR